jgi:GT2 family glycosyltransferase
MIDIVSATRLPEAAFWEESALGRSLRRFHYDGRLKPHVAYENRRGLPEVYNARLLAPDAGDIQVFIHDDVWIDDIFFADHLLMGLAHADVLGVAGSRRRVPFQPCWHQVIAGKEIVWEDQAYLSGSIAHGDGPFGVISHYGHTPAECELLDGLLLAVRTRTARERECLFDARFAFHFYDMDFCRTARRRDLKLSTWPISVTHQSGGGFFSEPWKAAMREYFAKWDS